jgi:hypothetical protein
MNNIGYVNLVDSCACEGIERCHLNDPHCQPFVDPSLLTRLITRIKEMHETERAIWRGCVMNDHISVSGLKMTLKHQIDQTEKFLNEIETTVPKED